MEFWWWESSTPTMAICWFKVERTIPLRDNVLHVKMGKSECFCASWLHVSFCPFWCSDCENKNGIANRSRQEFHGRNAIIPKTICAKFRISNQILYMLMLMLCANKIRTICIMGYVDPYSTWWLYAPETCLHKVQMLIWLMWKLNVSSRMCRLSLWYVLTLSSKHTC